MIIKDSTTYQKCVTFEDFSNIVNALFQNNQKIAKVDCKVEDSVPWVYILGKKNINPEFALELMNNLQKEMSDEVLFNSLSKNKLKIVVNGKFHFSVAEQEDFDDTYAEDFGVSIEEMKQEYDL